ncbi:MAG: class II aldolase/adducin family protein [Rhizomicrobium sp.]
MRTPGSRPRGKNALTLRNHGTWTVGTSVADAFLRMYLLERACEPQFYMLAAGRTNINAPRQGFADRVKVQPQAQACGC